MTKFMPGGLLLGTLADVYLGMKVPASSLSLRFLVYEKSTNFEDSTNRRYFDGKK
jgi:hypothetical protein